MTPRWPYIIIIMLLIVVILKDGCNEYQGTTSKDPDTLSHSSVARVDSSERVVVPERDTVHHFHTIERIVEVPVTFDLDSVIRDYFTKNPLELSYRDSEVVVTMTGFTWKNYLHEARFKIKNLRPTQIDNTTLVAPPPVELRNKIYAGVFVSLHAMKPEVGAMASFQNKKDNIITVAVGTNQTYLIGAQWKISFRGHPP